MSREACSKGLRFVVIDEIHSFIQSERGSQLSSVLKRAETYCASALSNWAFRNRGNPEMVSRWLAGPDTAVVSEEIERSLDARVMLDPDETRITEALRILREPKVLIFVKSRRQAEQVGWTWPEILQTLDPCAPLLGRQGAEASCREQVQVIPYRPHDLHKYT